MSYLNNQSTDSDAALISKITGGKVNIGDLDLENVHVFNAVLQALDSRYSLVRTLDPKNKYEKKIIIAWLQARPSGSSDPSQTVSSPSAVATLSRKIASLDFNKVFSEESHDNDIIRTYLSLVLVNKADMDYCKIFQSFDKEMLIKILFTTLKGEEIVYRDKELDVPIYMLADADITFKIADPYKFVKFIDINLQQITMPLVISKFMPIISTTLRYSVVKVIKEKGICYYDLTSYYGEIAEMLKNELQHKLSCAGIKVNDAYIKHTSIPNGIDKIFENQRIEFMQREKTLALHHKAEQLALENYEKKAEIHNKYPGFELGLTEREKDNALDRYISKTNLNKNESFEQSTKVTVDERSDDIGSIKNVVEVFADKVEVEEPNFTAELIGLGVAAAAAVTGFCTLKYIIGYFLLAGAVALGVLSVRGILKKKKAKADSLSAAKPAAPKSDSASAGGEKIQ